MAEVTRQGDGQDVRIALGGATLVFNANVDIAASADTWTPGLSSIFLCGSNNPGAITKTDSNTSSPPAVVLTTTGAVTGARVWAIGCD